MKEVFYDEFIKIGFLSVRLIDIIDYFLVALLVIQLYKLFKSSLAFTILLGIFTYLITWLLVQQLDMHLLSNIMGYFVSVGALALLIVFQQEVRRFLLLIGRNTILNDKRPFQRFLPWKWNLNPVESSVFETVLEACREMSATKTGAIIVFAHSSELKFVVAGGEHIDSEVSKLLLLSIFYKNSPLHDGAVIISNNRVSLAGSVLPVSENQDLSPLLGLRHKAAIGITEQSDAVVLVVSEETGTISLINEGKLLSNLSDKEMLSILEQEFSINKKASKSKKKD